MGEGNKQKTFHIDGAGSRPDGTGSGYAWKRLDRDEHRVRWVDGLTNNMAEYCGLIAVLSYVSPGSCALIETDSQLVANQFSGKWAVNDDELIELLSTARELIEQKSLQIEVRWIRREQNSAGKLLDKAKQRRVAM